MKETEKKNVASRKRGGRDRQIDRERGAGRKRERGCKTDRHRDGWKQAKETLGELLSGKRRYGRLVNSHQ